MSQSQRQERYEDHNIHRNSPSPQLYNGRITPTNRGPGQQSSSTSTLIPRDYLSRSEGANSKSTFHLNTRNFTPSPLGSNYPTQEDSPPHDLPMPSRAHLDTSRHQQRYHALGGDGQSPESDNDAIRVTKLAGGLLPEQTHNPLKGGVPISMADTTVQKLSPPESPVSETSSIPHELHQSRTPMPRTASLDSAVSSISSATGQGKPSLDMSSVGPTEIRSLIASAGSVENLVTYLLKEKQHIATQNAQLWKLVDKQRSLLLGLNKDLERVSKDKERYKKKLKEVQEPALPAAPQPQPSETSRSMATPLAETFARRMPDKLKTPEKQPSIPSHSSPPDPAMMPMPLHLQQPQFDPVQRQPILDESGVMPSKVESSDIGFLHQRGITITNGFSPADEAHDNDNGSQSTNGHVDRRPVLNVQAVAPALAVIEPSPAIEKPEKSFLQSRKKAPAPLDLQNAKSVANIQQALRSGDSSGSDYERPLNLTESPIDRGRKKTREDDDRNRELVAVREEEGRSQSQKKSRSKGAQPLDPLPAKEAMPPSKPALPPNGLPASPRMIPPPSAFAGALQPPTSINSVLVADNQQSTSINERLIALPLKSPGLPMSPRPMDRPPNSALPRMPNQGLPSTPGLQSPRAMGMMASLPLSPRAPRQPIPLPPNVPQALVSPRQAQVPPTPRLINPASHTPSADRAATGLSPISPEQSTEIYRGFIDQDYPDLLIPPNALPSVYVRVASSKLRPSRNSYIAQRANDEDQVFVLSIVARYNNKELWRVEKVILALPALDQQMKALCKFTVQLPERKLFSGHSPAVLDARKSALNSYFNDLLDTPMDEEAAIVLCNFFSTDVIEPRDDETSLLAGPQKARPHLALGPDGRPRKEGYLTKRGKNFGGWKARFFVLQGPDFRYFESPGGPHLGTIKLYNAQIGKQADKRSSSQSDDDTENQYRHAFVILEPKRKDSASLVRHVLCAESDHERDEWVQALLRYVDCDEDENFKNTSTRRFEDGKSHITGFEAKMKRYAGDTSDASPDSPENDQSSQLKGFSYENATTGVAPKSIGSVLSYGPEGRSSPNGANQMTNSASSINISGPLNAQPIQDSEAWGNKQAISTQRPSKKHGLFDHFHRQRSTSDLVSASGGKQPTSKQVSLVERKGPVRVVFGLPLAEAVEFCAPSNVDVKVPAVVYRCIEYLKAKNAANEEGIFRLSGSNLVVRTIKERFNTEGDIDLVADEQYYDVHAVASLFKTYLRELPSPILTRDLHLDFLQVLELDDKSNKISAFSSLVHKLPLVNYALLRILAEYLTEIIENSDKNKMNVRNVGIVFTQTLNIPAPVFTMFLTEFDAIFGDGPGQGPSQSPEPQIRSTEISAPAGPSMSDLRSPRQQMFSDLSTPSYKQTTFTRGPPPSSFAARPYEAQSSKNPIGFAPMHPSYENRQYVSEPHQQQQPQQQSQPPPPPQPRYALVHQAPAVGEMGSMNAMLAPDSATNTKSKRRESSMMMLAMGNRMASAQRDEQNQL